jgi:hypothetical protein
LHYRHILFFYLQYCLIDKNTVLAPQSLQPFSFHSLQLNICGLLPAAEWRAKHTLTRGITLFLTLALKKQRDWQASHPRFAWRFSFLQFASRLCS